MEDKKEELLELLLEYLSASGNYFDFKEFLEDEKGIDPAVYDLDD